MTAIDGFDYHRRCKSDGYEMSLMEKLRESYHGRWHDPRATAISDRMGAAFFLFITISEIYLAVQYVVPEVFANYSEWTRYCLKVFCWFVFIETMANWICIRHRDTSYRVTADNSAAPAIHRQNIGTVLPSMEENGWKNLGRNVRHLEWKQFRPDGSTELRYAGNDVVHSAMSWRWCKSCQHDQPPRCHHCVICDRCILKRDHHCYMTGVCIGLTNQRHFVVMNFYIAIASLSGFYYIASYLSNSFVPRADRWDYVLPVTIYRWAFSDGWIETHHVIMIIHVYTLWWTGFSAVGFFLWHIGVISLGKTTHEVRTGAQLRCTATVAENFRSVFGLLWLLNFVFPAHIAYQELSDGIHWTNVKSTGSRLPYKVTQ